ncbi:unnamed protein product, partial [Iphiclides podalirius]
MLEENNKRFKRFSRFAVLKSKVSHREGFKIRGTSSAPKYYYVGRGWGEDNREKKFHTKRFPPIEDTVSRGYKTADNIYDHTLNCRWIRGYACQHPSERGRPVLNDRHIKRFRRNASANACTPSNRRTALSRSNSYAHSARR